MLTYRMFYARDGGLQSFAMKSTWEPGENLAVCYRLPSQSGFGWHYRLNSAKDGYVSRHDDHLVPGDRCACGFYGIEDVEALYRWYALDHWGQPMSIKIPGYAFAAIWQYGNIIVHDDGWVRSEKARILALGKVLSPQDKRARFVPSLSSEALTFTEEAWDIDPRPVFTVVEEQEVLIPELIFQKYGVPYRFTETAEELKSFLQEVAAQYEPDGYRKVV